jgi:hypothetical protein
MLCDHSGPTPAMHTMPAQLRPHEPVKPRELALMPIVTTRLPEAGPAYTWQLSRTPRISPQTNTFLSCALCPHSCAPGKDFPVGHPSLQFSDGLPEKKLQLVGMSILINPIKPWARMSQNQDDRRFLQAVMPESPSSTRPEISFGQHAVLK